MNRIDRRSLVLLIALLGMVVALALASDLWASQRAGQQDAQILTPDPRRSPWIFNAEPPATRGLGTTVRTLSGITALVGVGSIVLAFGAHSLERMATLASRQRWMPLVGGGAALISSILLAALAVISVVAIPLVPLIGLAVLAASAFGVLVVALCLGRWLRALVGSEPHVFADLVTGILLLALGIVVPFVGRIVLLVAICWGLGIVVLSRRRETVL